MSRTQFSLFVRYFFFPFVFLQTRIVIGNSSSQNYSTKRSMVAMLHTIIYIYKTTVRKRYTDTKEYHGSRSQSQKDPKIDANTTLLIVPTLHRL
jgi:hypothetical protein